MSDEEQAKIEEKLAQRSLDNFFRFEPKTHKAILAKPNETTENEREFIPNNMHIIEVPMIYEQ